MTEAADKRGEEEEEEIVASTSALDIVKSWLGPPAEGEEDLDRVSASLKFTFSPLMPRPQMARQIVLVFI